VSPVKYELGIYISEDGILTYINTSSINVVISGWGGGEKILNLVY
jgi:hypothetical protein